MTWPAGRAPFVSSRVPGRGPPLRRGCGPAHVLPRSNRDGARSNRARGTHYPATPQRAHPLRLAAVGVRPYESPKGPTVSLFRSRSSEQTETVQELHADAARDYQEHNSAGTQAAARVQSGQTRANGNAAGGFRWGR